MLVAMTYNVGLFVSLIFGTGIGYFLFMRSNIRSMAGDEQETEASCCD